MDKINVNEILHREQEIQKIKDILKDFESNRDNPLFKKGIYIYGEPGTGKTTFVMNALKELNYDAVCYDAGDIRNKSIIDTLTKHTMSDKNIMSMFHKKIKKIAIVMDEIDGMNNGDKGGINTLIKLIRPKKTKKQKLEEVTVNPIICIGNYHVDKKMKELMKVCNVIELKKPTSLQMNTLVDKLITNIDNDLQKNICNFIQNDLRKLKIIYTIYKKNQSILTKELIQNLFQIKSYNDDTKQITQKLIQHKFNMEDHLSIMNETDRTIVGLLWHENIIDVLGKMKPNVSIPGYLQLLENMCFADYIDRITFQKQIWQFNEMSSLIKTCKNNKLYHDLYKKKPKYSPSEVRFTKVLTKYSTEYNNSVFIHDLCQQLGMDKKDLFAFFLDIKDKYNDTDMLLLFENYDISKLDIHRMYRFLDKFTKEDTEGEEEIEEEVVLPIVEDKA
uniref:AAA+ ATPase domain-containing protein n=1 Tax=viral metagenome TaxID=1070528 RepID=A0A6C0B2E5_9ZZZZ